MTRTIDPGRYRSTVYYMEIIRQRAANQNHP